MVAVRPVSQEVSSSHPRLSNTESVHNRQHCMSNPAFVSSLLVITVEVFELGLRSPALPAFLSPSPGSIPSLWLESVPTLHAPLVPPLIYNFHKHDLLSRCNVHVFIGWISLP